MWHYTVASLINKKRRRQRKIHLGADLIGQLLRFASGVGLRYAIMFCLKQPGMGRKRAWLKAKWGPVTKLDKRDNMVFLSLR